MLFGNVWGYGHNPGNCSNLYSHIHKNCFIHNHYNQYQYSYSNSYQYNYPNNCYNTH